MTQVRPNKESLIKRKVFAQTRICCQFVLFCTRLCPSTVLCLPLLPRSVCRASFPNLSSLCLLMCRGSCPGQEKRFKSQKLLFNRKPPVVASADAHITMFQEFSRPEFVSLAQPNLFLGCRKYNFLDKNKNWFLIDSPEDRLQEPWSSPPPPRHPPLPSLLSPGCQSPKASLPCVCIRSILSFCCSYSHPPSLAPCAAPDFV